MRYAPMQQTTEAGRPMVLLVVCLALIAAGPRNADAGSRGTKLAIGAGILGAIILSEQAQKKRVFERPSSRKTVEPRSKSAIRDYGANEGRQARSSRVQETSVARRARHEKSIDPKPEIVEAMPSEGRIAPVPHSEGRGQPRGQDRIGRASKLRVARPSLLRSSGPVRGRSLLRRRSNLLRSTLGTWGMTFLPPPEPWTSKPRSRSCNSRSPSAGHRQAL